MDGTEINFFLKKIKREKKGNYGVYSADTIPIVKSFPTGYVVNTDDSNLPGEHWVAFYYEKPHKLAEYFDSYGFSPSRKSFLKALPEKYKYSSHSIQGLFSVTCGLYCLFFLEKRAENKSMQEVISTFTSDPDWNDNKVKRYFFKKHQKNHKIKNKSFVCNKQICSTKNSFLRTNQKRK